MTFTESQLHMKDLKSSMEDCKSLDDNEEIDVAQHLMDDWNAMAPQHHNGYLKDWKLKVVVLKMGIRFVIHGLDNKDTPVTDDDLREAILFELQGKVDTSKEYITVGRKGNVAIIAIHGVKVYPTRIQIRHRNLTGDTWLREYPTKLFSIGLAKDEEALKHIIVLSLLDKNQSMRTAMKYKPCASCGACTHKDGSAASKNFRKDCYAITQKRNYEYSELIASGCPNAQAANVINNKNYRSCDICGEWDHIASRCQNGLYCQDCGRHDHSAGKCILVCPALFAITKDDGERRAKVRKSKEFRMNSEMSGKPVSSTNKSSMMSKLRNFVSDSGNEAASANGSVRSGSISSGMRGLGVNPTTSDVRKKRHAAAQKEWGFAQQGQVFMEPSRGRSDMNSNETFANRVQNDRTRSMDSGRMRSDRTRSMDIGNSMSTTRVSNHSAAQPATRQVYHAKPAQRLVYHGTDKPQERLVYNQMDEPQRLVYIPNSGNEFHTLARRSNRNWNSNSATFNSRRSGDVRGNNAGAGDTNSRESSVEFIGDRTAFNAMNERNAVKARVANLPTWGRMMETVNSHKSNNDRNSSRKDNGRGRYEDGDNNASHIGNDSDRNEERNERQRRLPRVEPRRRKPGPLK